MVSQSGDNAPAVLSAVLAVEIECFSTTPSRNAAFVLNQLMSIWPRFQALPCVHTSIASIA